MGDVPAGPHDPDDRDPWDLGPAPGRPDGDVLEGGLRPPWWRGAWTAVPRRARIGLAVLVVLGIAVAAGLELRERAAERAVAREVSLAASMSLSSLSTTPPGGQVSFFVVVRNEGARPVRVTGVEGSAGGLRLRMQDGVERLVSPDGETAVPVSVLLTCAGYDGGEELSTEIAVRRADGSRTTRQVRPDPAQLLLDVADTLCRSRPDLRDQEISGPVLEDLVGDVPDR